jgi:hypothetical protein
MLDAHDEDLGDSNPLPLNVPSAGGDQQPKATIGFMGSAAIPGSRS